MESVINSVALMLMVMCSLGVVFCMRKLRDLNDRVTQVVKAIVSSIEHSRENFKKLDQVSLQIERSRKHQSKIFDHHRVLLGSLNSQLIKLDLMINASGSEEKQSTARDENNTAVGEPVERSEPGRSYVKVNRDVLPKTENGMLLLEEVFKRRELSKLPATAHELANGKSVRSVQNTPAQSMTEEPVHATNKLEKVESTDHKNELADKAQAPHQQTGRNSLLKLFAERPPVTARSNEQFKRSA